jgi:hypothetical protein
MDINVRFCRLLIGSLRKEFRKDHPEVRIMKHAWVIQVDHRGHWEFHISEGPSKGFYWYGRAHNAYDARYQGWHAWSKQQKRGKP